MCLGLCWSSALRRREPHGKDIMSSSSGVLPIPAALALGGYGMSAKVAVPALMQLVRDENADAARAAGVALRCVFPEPVAPISSTSVRRTVAHGS